MDMGIGARCWDARRAAATSCLDLETGVYTLECGEQDLPRTRELIRRYADLPLGFADAAVIACAERHGGRVLTLDLRDFGVVAREGRITLAPAPGAWLLVLHVAPIPAGIGQRLASGFVGTQERVW
jgi:hypothetical protein